MTERLLRCGATGDLAGRFLLPALAELWTAGELLESFEVIGAARQELSDEASRRTGGRADRAARTWSRPQKVDTPSLQRTESTMSRSRPRYPPEFREQIVELVRAGRTPEELAEEYEPSSQTIRNWVTQSERARGSRNDGLTTDEKEELRALRRENQVLRQEKEILKKAAAWFARERPRE